MISFLIEFSLLFGFFGLVNFLLIRHLGNYDFRRKYLLISTLISFVIPFIPSPPGSSITVFSELLPSVEIIATGFQQSTPVLMEQGISPFKLLFLIYILVTGVLLLRFLIASFRLNQILGRKEITTYNKRRIIYATAVKNPCSFFKTILLPDDKIFTDDELQAVIRHESLHIENNHSIEKIFFALVKIICWWHPTTWYYAHDIDLIHELQVDEQMESFMSPKKYKEILLQLIINPPRLRLTHSFSTNIKKRIQTMNQKKKKFSTTQLFSLCAILCVSAFFIHSCSEPTETTYSTKVDDINVIAKSNPSSDKFYETMSTDTIVTFDMETYEETVQITENQIKVYKEPQTMPMFPGCDPTLPTEELKECSTQKLLQFIYTNIKYPAEARINGIEGMILIKFIVSDEGVVGAPEFIKTLGHGMEETVKEMMQKMREEYTWIPGKDNGKNVNVEYTLPIKFKLQD